MEKLKNKPRIRDKKGKPYTIKQKKALDLVIENHGNVSKAMRDAGYTPDTAKNPVNLTTSRGWKYLINKYLNDELLTDVHRRLLLKIDSDGQPHSDSKNALDMAYKLKGAYHKLEMDITSNNKPLFLPSEIIEKYQIEGEIVE